jgi:hypothetical protein
LLYLSGLMEPHASNPQVRANSTAGVLWLLLGAIWLARGIAPVSHTMYAWGLNLNRFLPLWAGWTMWCAGALALYPIVGHRLTPLLERGPGPLAARAAGLIFASGCGGIVFLLSDRAWWTGDFLLRQGASETGGFAGTFANALPVEILLNRWLPLLVRPASSPDPNLVTRLIEAALAVALACCAMALAREWGLRGLSRVTAVAVIVFGGYLLTFTGLGKPTALVCVLSASCLLGGTRLLNSGRSGLLFGTSLALALLTHRAALTLLPLGVVVWLKALAASRKGILPRSQVVAAIAPPVIASLLIAHRLVRILVGYDLPRHLAPAATHETGLLAAALDPLRLLDLANLLIVLTPALLVALLVVALDRPPPPASRRQRQACRLGARTLVPAGFHSRPSNSGHLPRPGSVRARRAGALHLVCARARAGHSTWPNARVARPGGSRRGGRALGTVAHPFP